MKKFIFIFVLLLSACGGSPSSATAVDPYVMVENSQRTAEAAQADADFYGSQLTATANAPIVGITQTAASFSMQATYAVATVESAKVTQVAAMTQTAWYWTPSPIPSATPNATTTAVFAQSFAEATAIHNETELSNLKVARAEYSNVFWAVILPILIMTLLLALAYFGITLSRSLRTRVVPRDQNGDSPLIMDIVNGEIIDNDANPNYKSVRRSLPVQVTEHLLIKYAGFIPDLPPVTADRQDKVKELDQLTVKMSKLPRLTEDRRKPALQTPMEIPAPAVDDFLLPDWNLIKDWDGKGGIPYFTAHGLKLVDPDIHPHFSVLGTTGVGKSRRFLRPMIACAVAAGDRVIILGKGADFMVFDHPNVSLVKVSKFTQLDQVIRYCDMLSVMVDEMNRRDDVLISSGHSTWTRSGNARTWLVLDELGNALDMVQVGMPDEAKRIKMYVKGLVSEGRKAGFNVVLANQRATGMASILSQTGKVIFRVEHDEEKAHRSLVGASSLAEGYYFARFGISELAGAFEPTDQQLRDFIADRGVPALEPDKWLEGKLVENKLLVEEIVVPTDSPVQLDPKIEEERDRIIQLNKQGKSYSAIVKEIWGFTSGTPWNNKRAYVEQVVSETTATSPLKVPINGVLS